MISFKFKDLDEDCIKKIYYQYIAQPPNVTVYEKTSFHMNEMIEYVLGSKEFNDHLDVDVDVDLIPSIPGQSTRYLAINQLIEDTIKAIKTHSSVVIKNGYIHDHADLNRKYRRETPFDALEIKDQKAILHMIYTTTKPKKTLLDDNIKEITYVFQVVRNALAYYHIELNQVYLYGFNPNYRRNGEVRFNEMIKIQDISSQLLSSKEILPPANFITLIENPKEPPLYLSKSSCATCPYQNKVCWPNGLPDIAYLYRLQADDQTDFYQNYKQVANIPDALLKKDYHRIQKQAIVDQKPYQDLTHIQNFISQLKYPLSFLDFETIRYTFPIYDGFSINQTIPFQYALDVIETPEYPIDYNKIKHYEFIGNGIDDPSEDLLKRLLSQIPSSGDIIVYHSNAERNFLKALIALYGYENEINELINRIVDLKDAFESKTGFHYYHKDFNGSFSLKTIVNTLLEKTYKTLEIKDGLNASHEYEMLKWNSSKTDVEKIREDLLKYCNFDARVMIDLLDFLQKLK